MLFHPIGIYLELGLIAFSFKYSKNECGPYKVSVNYIYPDILNTLIIRIKIMSLRLGYSDV